MSFFGASLKVLVSAVLLGGGGTGLYSAVYDEIPATAVEAAESWQPDLQRLEISEGQTIGIPSTPQTHARPLFSPTRRLIAIAQPEPEVEPEPDEPIIEPAPDERDLNLQLKGVLMMPDGAKALIGSNEQPDGVWLKVGAEVDGWQVNRITKDMVEVSTRGGKHVIGLYKEN